VRRRPIRTLGTLPWLDLAPDVVASAPPTAARLSERLQIPVDELRLYGTRKQTGTDHLREVTGYPNWKSAKALSSKSWTSSGSLGRGSTTRLPRCCSALRASTWRPHGQYAPGRTACWSGWPSRGRNSLRGGTTFGGSPPGAVPDAGGPGGGDQGEVLVHEMRQVGPLALCAWVPHAALAITPAWGDLQLNRHADRNI
jgi:hypothetical protein